MEKMGKKEKKKKSFVTYIFDHNLIKSHEKCLTHSKVVCEHSEERIVTLKSGPR